MKRAKNDIIINHSACRYNSTNTHMGGRERDCKVRDFKLRNGIEKKRELKKFFMWFAALITIKFIAVSCVSSTNCENV